MEFLLGLIIGAVVTAAGGTAVIGSKIKKALKR